MRKIYIDDQLPANYSDPIKSNKSVQLPQKIEKDGRTYTLEGISKKKYSPGEIGWLGMRSLGKTVLTLGFGLIISKSLREDWKTFWVGKRNIAVYKAPSDSLSADPISSGLSHKASVLSKSSESVSSVSSIGKKVIEVDKVPSDSASSASIPSESASSETASDSASSDSVPSESASSETASAETTSSESASSESASSESISADKNAPIPVDADSALIPHILQHADLKNLGEAAEFFRLLSSVSKSFAPTVTDTQLSMLNSGKARLIDLPGVKDKDKAPDLNKALAYVQLHKANLTCLDFSGFFNPGLSDADITAIGTSFPHLKILITGASSITDLGIAEIVKLTELKKLDVISNLARAFPALDSLTHLQELIISGDYFQKIPSLDNLRNLQKLSISGNSLQNLPSLKELTNLQELSISGGSLQNLPLFDGLETLQSLRISVGFLQNLPSLDDLKNLKRLFIWGDSLQDLPSLKELKSLQQLIIRVLSVEELPSLDDLENLNDLFIEGFSLQELPSLDELKSLQKLDIRARALRELPLLDELQNLNSAMINGKKVV